MTLAVGIFDLFTYGIPGALHLSLIIYVLARLNLIDLASLASAPSVLQVVGAAVASYLLGQLAYPLSALLDKVAPRWNWSIDHARREFVARVPESRERAFVRADTSLLLAAAELHDKEAAGEITRLQGVALLLRNSALALVFALAVAVLELVLGTARLPAGGCAALLLVSLIAAIRHGRRVRHWDRLKTLEICFWIPDIDDRLDSTP
ncbi:hypothetical protein ACH4RA_02405 [Streptomyces smyrnaeus]|uniref:hypothetical protein n=1 Tax=Streptomyces TaxID=1883 RepID=UPI000C1967D7|nr:MULTISPECIES: hypothetical protein [unclassified Streptomyces]MBQ0862285.1 hypothetical protein [Streptomyces sp. RK75]MBQ1122870.1 hypothetical protein [Streptomyces sp. B15]MBQ1159000.1 hypothetical protein [Streptomyces sp. A73]